MRWVNEKLLAHVLDFVARSPHSDFYRAKYARAGVVVDIKNFDSLPLLTRQELVTTPLAARTFVSSEEVRFAAFTSGTSSDAPLVTVFGDVEHYHFEPSLGLSVTRPLIIYPPLNKAFGHTFVQQCAQAERQVSPLFGDFQNLHNSARLAQEFGCDAIYATPTLAAMFAPIAHELGIAGNIKLLALSSETLTETRRNQLKVHYPSACIADLYASSEIGQFVLFPCTKMLEEGRAELHLTHEALAAAELSSEGELIVSYGLNRACPLVRYQTGDFFEVVGDACGCGLPGPILKWSHRSGVDRLRINGIEFDVEEADRAFQRLPHLPMFNYQIHFLPSGVGGGVAMRVEVVEAVLSGDPRRSLHLKMRLESELPDLWHISSTATLRTALERGLLSSFSAEVVSKLSVEGLKTKRFINKLL